MTRDGVTRRRRGSEAISALLAAPLVVGLLCAGAEYGRYADVQLRVAEIARGAAREGAMRPHHWNPGPAETALVIVQGDFARERLGGTAGARLVGEAPDQRLEVTAEVPYLPLLGVVPTPRTVRATSSFRVNDQ